MDHFGNVSWVSTSTNGTCSSSEYL